MIIFATLTIYPASQSDVRSAPSLDPPPQTALTRVDQHANWLRRRRRGNRRLAVDVSGGYFAPPLDRFTALTIHF